MVYPRSHSLTLTNTPHNSTEWSTTRKRECDSFSKSVQIQEHEKVQSISGCWIFFFFNLYCKLLFCQISGGKKCTCVCRNLSTHMNYVHSLVHWRLWQFYVDHWFHCKKNLKKKKLLSILKVFLLWWHIYNYSHALHFSPPPQQTTRCHSPKYWKYSFVLYNTDRPSKIIFPPKKEKNWIEKTLDQAQ